MILGTNEKIIRQGGFSFFFFFLSKKEEAVGGRRHLFGNIGVSKRQGDSDLKLGNQTLLFSFHFTSGYKAISPKRG